MIYECRLCTCHSFSVLLSEIKCSILCESLPEVAFFISQKPFAYIIAAETIYSTKNNTMEVNGAPDLFSKISQFVFSKTKKLI